MRLEVEHTPLGDTLNMYQYTIHLNRPSPYFDISPILQKIDDVTYYCETKQPYAKVALELVERLIEQNGFDVDYIDCTITLTQRIIPKI